MITLLFTSLLYVLLAPLFGGLVSGLDRKITARMQGRVGPPVLQPFYDVLKLFEKEKIKTRKTQNIFIIFYLLFVILSGIIFFSGGDILLFVFSVALAGIIFVFAGYKGSSPYSIIGAERELIQMMSYEPILILVAVGFYMTTGSFMVSDIFLHPKLLFLSLPGIFIALVYVLTIKLRKSPFDLSTSHHGHQELVKGITTEFSGPYLGIIEIAHWYETSFILGLVYLFFSSMPILAIFVILFFYLFEIFIDNTFARYKWQLMLGLCWGITGLLCFINIFLLNFLS